MIHERRVAILTVCVLSLTLATYARTGDSNTLHQVRKIYILPAAYPEHPDAEAAHERVLTLLKAELTSLGFSIVDESAKADATLQFILGEMIVVDGPQPDPPEYTYDYELTLPNASVVWHADIRVRGREPKDEIDRRAAKKSAKKLSDAWRKSAKRAGISTGDRLPNATWSSDQDSPYKVFVAKKMPN